MKKARDPGALICLEHFPFFTHASQFCAWQCLALGPFHWELPAVATTIGPRIVESPYPASCLCRDGSS